MAKLTLLIDSYEQPQSDDDPRGVRHLVSYSKGDVFEPVNAAEAERLKEIGAALDPKEAAEKVRQDAQDEADRLRAQAAALEAQADAAETPQDDLSTANKSDLVAFLEANDLDTSGKVDELRARAQAHQASQE